MNAPLCESPLSSRPPAACPDFEARLSTVQLVVATETKRLSPDAVTAAVQWSVSSAVVDVSGSREGERRNAHAVFVVVIIAEMAVF